jgi:hypothetical protein
MTSVKAHLFALSFFLPLALGASVSSAPDTFAPVPDAPVVEGEVLTITPQNMPQTPPVARPDGCPAIVVETFGDEADNACAVSYCESRWNPLAVGDQGRSLGMFQLFAGTWAPWYGVAPEQLLDPVVNTAVARAVWQHRGRWGGAGGWTCADLIGIE